MVKVAINGYGTIGKRIADALLKMDDMNLIGVTKFTPDFSAMLANRKGIPIYTTEDRIEKFEEIGIKISGTVEELIKKADLVVDASPNKVGEKNKKMYEENGVKAIFQGGEKAHVADISFSALCNYEAALGKRFVRVVSCNTTALCRLICALKNSFKIEKVRAVLVRRAADPHQIDKGPINALLPKPIRLPSHHGPDVQSVIPDVDIVTTAIVAPTTIMHLHVVNIKFGENVNERDVIEVLRETPRILLINSEKTKIKGTSQIIEFARDLGRIRYDLYENIVWEDSIKVVDGELWLVQAVHQEAIVVPENIDAIRAMMELERNPMRSIEKTDKVLGIMGRL